MTDNHTPGPWYVEMCGSTGDYDILCDQLTGHPLLAVVFNRFGNSRDDADLIAAAPDMLEALREALPLFDEGTTIAAKIEAAISKATGK